MSRKPGIPAIPPVAQDLYTVLVAVKENIELLTGIRGGNISPLTATASTDDIVAKVNEVIERLNGRL